MSVTALLFYKSPWLLENRSSKASATKLVDMGLRQLLLLDAVPLVAKEELPLISFLPIPAESYVPYFDKGSLL